MISEDFAAGDSFLHHADPRVKLAAAVAFSVVVALLDTRGPLPASSEGVWQALLITLKSNAIILALLALLATTPVITLAHAANHLFVPAKLVHLFFFTYRYIHVLHAEYVRDRKSTRLNSSHG